MTHVPEKIYIPAGFRFAGVASGIKKSGKRDVSVLVADQKCVTHGAFTQNLVRASSVDWNESRVGESRALVINSGNANACTGAQGEQDTADMAKLVAESIDCSPDEVMVMSTGIIGEKLPMQNVATGITSATEVLDCSTSSVSDFAEGILTTDKFSKICSRQFETESGNYSILGIAKGAGMIGPRMLDPKMATMLCVLVTDFPLPGRSSIDLMVDAHFMNGKRFQQIIESTFNSISVDGHTSTSDQVVLFAPPGGEAPSEDAVSSFFECLTELGMELAKQIPADGEGATHVIEIEVQGKYSQQELKSVAKTIADSPLVKTAAFGADPNWGRIVSAAGYSGLEFDPKEMSLRVNGFLLFENGAPVDFDAGQVSQSMKENFDTTIQLDISDSSPSEEVNIARYWTSDLTYDYVQINAEYHT